MTTKEQFNKAGAEFGIMDVDSYYALLQNLAAQGSGWGKTENVAAFLLPDLKVQTETITGKVETTNTIKVDKVYLTFDVSQYPLENVRGLVVKDMAKNWGARTISEREMNSPDYSAAGIWLLKQGNFEFDYKKAEPDNTKSSVYAPSTEAYRVCLETDTAIKIPVTWEKGFTVEAGGAIAIRERDIPALIEALNDIRSGAKTAEEALVCTNEKGFLLAKFDIYGMEPDFLRGNVEKERRANYNPVTLKIETQGMMAGYASAIGKTPVKAPQFKK